MRRLTLLIALLIPLVWYAASRAGAQGVPPTEAPAPTPGPAHTQLLVRLADGTACAGIEVQLSPAPLDWGGPPAGTPGKVFTTDGKGEAAFPDLGNDLWMVSFSGNVNGRPLSPKAEQGKLPYGRTRSGDGFPLRFTEEPQEVPGKLVGVSTMFVLLPSPSGLIPTFDLALPDQTPNAGAVLTGTLPDAGYTANGPPNGFPSGGAADTGGAYPGGRGSDFGWVYLLAGLLCGAIIYWAIWKARLKRRAEERAAAETGQIDVQKAQPASASQERSEG